MATESFGPVPPSSWAFDPSQKMYATADPAKAKSIATGFSFNLKVTNNPDNIQGGQLIKAPMEKAGITVNLQIEDFGQLLNETEAQKFDAALA